jgi:hypothetical protein
VFICSVGLLWGIDRALGAVGWVGKKIFMIGYWLKLLVISYWLLGVITLGIS